MCVVRCGGECGREGGWGRSGTGGGGMDTFENAVCVCVYVCVRACVRACVNENGTIK